MAKKALYSDIEPYHSFFLETGTQHSVFVEQCGNPAGIPVVFLHGGPCSGCKPGHRRFFNPEKYRVILFDQRGCGNSLPYGEIDNNTTQDLLEDMERIRIALEIDQWLLFGGSWGGTLTLLYAQQNPERVLGMIIRGVFLARQCDLDWFLGHGAQRIYPEQWEKLNQSLPTGSRNHVLQGMVDCLWGTDELAIARVVKEWHAWGTQVALGNSYDPNSNSEHATKRMTQLAKMEIHYAKNRYFLEENHILSHCSRLSKIPTTIIHGRRDLVCPIEAGYSLHSYLPQAAFQILPKAGHIAQGEDMVDALVTATDTMITQIHYNA